MTANTSRSNSPLFTHQDIDAQLRLNQRAYILSLIDDSTKEVLRERQVMNLKLKECIKKSDTIICLLKQYRQQQIQQIQQRRN